MSALGPRANSALHVDQDRCSDGSAGGDESGTGFAPPFHLLLEPTNASSVDPGAVTERMEPIRPVDGSFPAVEGYEIQSELGRGGMGVVYLARARSLKRQVALKMVLAGQHAEPALRVRFRKEAEAVARLQHPNIVQIYEVGECDGRPFLSLEYVAGGRLVPGSPRTERAAAQLIETLARAVDYMHQRGIVHRDLKPSNILLTVDGTPKIADFGLAKIIGDEVDLTRSRACFGTPSYMAPEQASREMKLVGGAADVYSLGAILYELLTGRPPFEGATWVQILEQVRNEPPAQPRRVRHSVPLDLETICLKCLEKEPGKRYSSALALADDLRCFLERRAIQARPIRIRERLWRAARRHPALAGWGLAAVATVSLSLTAFSYIRASGQLALHQADANYRSFVERRDEALLYGLLAPTEGSLFLGVEADANLDKAETAARQALALAGIGLDSPKVAARFPAAFEAEVASDCYGLLLVLASVRAHHPLGKNEKDRSREALAILDRSQELAAPTRAYYLRRADVLEQLGERDASEHARAQAAAHPADGAEDDFLVGEELYRRGEWSQATSSFDRALAREPSHFWAQFFLAVCHLKTGQWEAAKAGLNACLTQQPGFVWAHIFRGFADEKLRAYSEAEADFQTALRLNPNDDVRYVVFLMRGILQFNQRELREAAASFRSAIELKPEQYNAWLNLAHVQLAHDEFDWAAVTMTQALKLRPPRHIVAGYFVERGRKLLLANKYRESLEACNAARALAPDEPLSRELAGRAFLGLARYAEAERSFDQYLRNGGAAKSDIFRARGLARMKLGKYSEAVDDYTQALELAPDADIYQHRGWAHFFSDAWKLALRDFSKAIELDPAAADAYTGRGLARVMLGDYRQAVADAEVSLGRTPGTPEMMHNIACIMAQAAARAGVDTSMPDHQLLAASYERRACNAVRQTLSMLPANERSRFWRETILRDPALAPIREDTEFKRLGNKYGHF